MKNEDADLEELRKEFYYFMKDVAPQLTNFGNTITDLQNSVSQSIGGMQDVVKNVQSSVEILSSDFQSLKTDTQNSQQELSQLSSDIAALTSDMSTLQTDISQLQQSKNDMQTSLDNLSATQSSIQDGIAEIKDSQSNTQSQIDTLQANIDSLQATLTEVTDVTIPDLESKIGSGGGSAEWITLYDKDSPDPELNKGETGGLKSANSDTIIGKFDFRPYSKFRVLFVPLADEVYYEFNLAEFKDAPEKSSTKAYTYTAHYVDYSAQYLTAFSIASKRGSNGELLLNVQSIYRTRFKNKAYPTIESLESNASFHIAKFQVQ